MSELVDERDSKSRGVTHGSSILPPGTMQYKNHAGAYITGIALGDGNLSNPNGRAVRLRITCDNKYPNLIKRISNCLQTVFDENRVTSYKRWGNATDICLYSNDLEDFLGWKAFGGSKYTQNVRVPSWIFKDKNYMRSCLKGLIETDGSIYKDRTYTFVNFTTIIHALSQDVQIMLNLLGYKPNTQVIMQKSGKWKFVTRISKNVDALINDLQLLKD